MPYQLHGEFVKMAQTAVGLKLSIKSNGSLSQEEKEHLVSIIREMEQKMDDAADYCLEVLA